MSALRSALYAQLTNTGEDLYPLIALRAYPVRTPQNGTLPAVTFRRQSEGAFPAMGSDPSLREAQYELRAWAETADDAEDVADAIDSTLRRWRNASAPVVQDCFIDRGEEDYDEASELFFVQLFARIYYEDS